MITRENVQTSPTVCWICKGCFGPGMSLKWGDSALCLSDRVRKCCFCGVKTRNLVCLFYEEVKQHTWSPFSRMQKFHTVTTQPEHGKWHYNIAPEIEALHELQEALRDA